ncbi:hypothetical protein F4803DRAFT_32378 [Xylaria telfairii]|nr:hypothetical protein F4803DRAFT_32378 [Xylaria telfairii]
MKKFKNSGNHAGSLQSSKQKRRSRAKKNRLEEDGEKVAKEIERMMARGWTKEKDITANKVFLSGPLIVDGRLHATDKLCLSGDFIVTNKLECEGNFTLSGCVQLGGKPAMVKNMMILNRGTIYGDVVVSAGVYIKGQCTINGKLTIAGTFKLNGTLECEQLITSQPVEKCGKRKFSVTVKEEDTTKSEDDIAAELVRLLCGHETTTEE